jgi:hypothetical protein
MVRRVLETSWLMRSTVSCSAAWRLIWKSMALMRASGTKLTPNMSPSTRSQSLR